MSHSRRLVWGLAAVAVLASVGCAGHHGCCHRPAPAVSAAPACCEPAPVIAAPAPGVAVPPPPGGAMSFSPGPCCNAPLQ